VSIPFPDGWLIVIERYLSERGRRCFTYRGLRIWLYQQPEYRDVEWHTAERYIRDLVRLGYLERVKPRRRGRGRGQRYLYCLTERGEERLLSLKKRFFK